MLSQPIYQNEYQEYEVFNEVVNARYCPTNSIGAKASIDVCFDAGIDGDTCIALLEVRQNITYIFNSEGPVFGPNGEYELDPENDQCKVTVGPYQELARLPVFATCKNNCRGGKRNIKFVILF